MAAIVSALLYVVRYGLAKIGHFYKDGIFVQNLLGGGFMVAQGNAIFISEQEGSVQQAMLLLEYTEIMLGNKRHFSEDFFNGRTGASEERIVSFIRLVAKVYLQCDNFQQARCVFDADLVKKLKLDNIVREIRVPDYIDTHDRMDFIAARVFLKKFDPERWAMEHYCQRVLDGSLAKFPRNYMDGEIGLGRACYCLRYFLKLERPGSSALDLLHFSTLPEFRTWLQKHFLMNVCAKYYDTRVDYMYDSLPDDMKIDILYMICKTKYLMDRAPATIQEG